MKEIARMLLCVLAACAVFFLLFLGLKWNPIVCGVLCVGLYFGLDLLLRPRRKIGGIDVESLRGGEELQKLLEDAQGDLKKMSSATEAIATPAVRADAENLHQTGLRILAYLKEHPDKINLARRFFTYYLDTATALLSRYIEFQNTGLRSDEVGAILERTAKALPVLNSAFEKQFTHLMEGELLDVEADIALLESTLKMEGGK